MKPNATRQARLEAGAERTLEGVACSACSARDGLARLVAHDLPIRNEFFQGYALVTSKTSDNTRVRAVT